MSDRDAFIARIKAFPADDLTRLVYADYLEENGESERAEFIRLQIEQARFSPRDCNQGTCNSYGHGHCNACCRMNRLAERVKELIDARGYSWCSTNFPAKGLDKQPPAVIGLASSNARGGLGEPFRVEFRRGFISSVVCSWRTWVYDASRFYVDNPIESVRVPFISTMFRQFPRDPGPLVRYSMSVPMLKIERSFWIEGSLSDSVARSHIELGAKKSLDAILSERWPGVKFVDESTENLRNGWRLSNTINPMGEIGVAPIRDDILPFS